MMVGFCRTHLLCRSMCNVADDETTHRLGLIELSSFIGDTAVFITFAHPGG